jgi:ferrous iron transport protein B
MSAIGQKNLKIALVGNPNSGKSTVFNQLTGLRQRTGNFPGVTVEIMEGKLHFPNGQEALLLDLPGTYSIYPTSSDEKIVASVLCDPANPAFPDALVYVADVTHLEKHLLLFTQLLDLQVPILLALNMADSAKELGIKVNAAKLAEVFGVPVVPISGRTGDNILKLLVELERLLAKSAERPTAAKGFYKFAEAEKQVADAVQQNLGTPNAYRALLLAHHHNWLPFLQKTEKEVLAAIVETKNFQTLRAQVDETLDRFDHFTPIVQATVQRPAAFPNTPTDRIDAVLTHRWWGPLIFFGVMLLVFQAIFDWSDYPMTMIEEGFGQAGEWLKAGMPAAWYTDLLTDGFLEGLGGILVFVPQIAVLFLLITILEEVGYMARAVFMFDKFMRRFGMNGRSVVSLISGAACAIPAIMSSRTIGNQKERLITILVTPFMTCSARIPVYVLLIGLIIKEERVFGIVSTKSLALGAMYLFGLFMACLSGWVLKKWLRRREPSYLAIELPVYRMPHWKNVGLTVWGKVWAFVVGAGQWILIVTLVLWGLKSAGPGDALGQAEKQVRSAADTTNLDDKIKEAQLEASYLGHLGRGTEWVFSPLGYDWKIGVGVLASFAAREVFTGTLAVLYSMDSKEKDVTDREDNDAKVQLRQKMVESGFGGKNPNAAAFSLLIFYALAMQCFSTLAVVRRETGGWKWAVFQFVFMSALAYLAAWAINAIFG